MMMMVVVMLLCSDAEMYRLRHEEHMSLVRRLQSTIEAHVRLLSKVHVQQTFQLSYHSSTDYPDVDVPWFLVRETWIGR